MVKLLSFENELNRPLLFFMDIPMVKFCFAGFNFARLQNYVLSICK